MYGSLDISTSGLETSRIRLEVATANIANADSVEGPNGEYAPFRRRMAVVATGDPARGNKLGVHVSDIAQSDGPFRLKYDPGHTFADKDGYVKMPDIDPAIEQVNAMESMRAYEANVMAAEATKSMFSVGLRILG